MEISPTNRRWERGWRNLVRLGLLISDGTKTRKTIKPISNRITCSAKMPHWHSIFPVKAKRPLESFFPRLFLVILLTLLWFFHSSYFRNCSHDWRQSRGAFYLPNHAFDFRFQLSFETELNTRTARIQPGVPQHSVGFECGAEIDLSVKANVVLPVEMFWNLWCRKHWPFRQWFLRRCCLCRFQYILWID